MDPVDVTWYLNTFCRDHSPERLTGLMRKAVQTCNVELIYHLATCWDRIGDVQDFMKPRDNVL
jgi:hypothetical protein